ncbi:MAG: coenzyme A pyrophosphatase, partial [Novosphingobium sp. 35-62-5]
MSLLSRLTRLYDAGHRTPLQDLYEDWRPLPEHGLRPAAVLIAVTDRVGHPDGPG